MYDGTLVSQAEKVVGPTATAKKTIVSTDYTEPYSLSDSSSQNSTSPKSMYRSVSMLPYPIQLNNLIRYSSELSEVLSAARVDYKGSSDHIEFMDWSRG